MGANARLLVEVAASLGTFREDLGKAAASAEQSAKRVESAFGNAQAQVAAAGRKIISSLVGTLGTAAIARELSVIKEKTIDAQRSQAQFEAVLESTGHAAGLTAAQLEALGQSVAGASVFDDDDIRKAETALLRFRDVQGETFRETLKLAPGVATVLGIELPAAAILLGKAVSGGSREMRALKDAGVFLSEQTIDLGDRFKEAGDKAGAMKLKLDAIHEAIGGAGGADTKGLYGATKNLDRALDSLQKTAGRKLFGNDSAIARELTTSFEGLSFAIENVDALRRKVIFSDSFPYLKVVPNPTPKGREASGKIDTRARDEFEAEEARKVAASKAADEKQYTDRKLHLEKMAAGASTYYAKEFQLQKSAIESEQDAETFSYSRGEVSAEQHYANLRRLSKSNLDAITADLNHQIEAQLAIIDAKGKEGMPLFDENARETAKVKAEALVNQANAARYSFFKQDQQFTHQQIIDTEKLGDAYGELSEKIALAEGNSAKAASIAAERADREHVRELTHRRDTGNPQESQAASDELARIKRFNDLGQAQATLSDKTRDYQNVVEALGVAQARVDLEAQTGSLSEIDLLNKKADVARQYIPILTAQYEAQKKIIEADIANGSLFGTAKIDALARLQQMKLGIDQLAISTDRLKNKLDSTFTDNITTFLDDFAKKPRSIAEAFKKMTTSIGESFVHLFNDYLVKAAWKSLFGEGGQTGGVSPGGFIASLFGAAGSSGGGLGYGTAGSVIPAGPYPYASGTNFHPGGWARINEAGGEIVNLPRGSQVIPHDKSMRMLSGTTIQQTINVLPGATRQSAAQAGSEMLRNALRARRIQ